MIPMFKVVLLAGPALISTYSAHPSRIVNPSGGIVQALELDLVDLLNLPDASHIPPVVHRDMMTALGQAVNSANPPRVAPCIGLTHFASRHPMYKGEPTLILLRVVKC